MVKRIKVGVCALCGETVPITREHVPPKNLYLLPRPRNTITVPVCEPCNHGYHLDDEYFRVFVTMGAKPGTRLFRLWEEKVVASSFVRGGGLVSRLNDDHSKVVRRHFNVEPLRTIDNKVVANKWLPLVLPFNALRINAVIEKIVRCLHFHLYGAPLSNNSRFEVDITLLKSTDLQLLFDQCTGAVGDYKEFVFRREDLGNACSRWFLAFYKHRFFTIRINGS